jgi:spore germination protein KC
MFPLLRPVRGWAVLCLLLALTGCWDAREVEERTSVIALGVDVHPQGYEVTVQVPNPLKVVGSGGSGGGGGEGGQDAVQLFTGVGKTLNDAMNEIRNQTNQRIFFGHTQLLLIGDQMARKGISGMLDAFRRNPEIRRRQWALVVKGTAKDAMKASPKLAQIPMEYMVAMIANGVREGRYSEEGLGDLYSNIFNPGKQPILNFIEAEPEKVRWLGLAILNKDRMAGLLPEKESQALLQLRDEEVGESFHTPCDKRGYIVFQPQGLKRDVRIQFQGSRPVIQVNVDVRGEIVEKSCDVDLSRDPVIHALEKQVQRRYEHHAQTMVEKLQKQFRTDACNFGNRVRAYYPQKWKQLNWSEAFTQADVQVNYHVKILRIGLEAK